MLKIKNYISQKKWDSFHSVVFLSVIAFFISSVVQHAKSPTWWENKGAIQPDAVENNQALANIGQAKNMATQAEAALSEILTDGSGIDLSTKIPAKPANPDAAWFENQRKPQKLKTLS